MKQRQRDQLRTRMTEEIAALRRTVAELEDNQQPVAPDVAIGRLSRLDTMLNQGIQQSSLLQSQRRLAQLEASLRDLDSPDFGYCDDCGERIALPRLMALPESRFCIRCAQ